MFESDKWHTETQTKCVQNLGVSRCSFLFSLVIFTSKPIAKEVSKHPALSSAFENRNSKHCHRLESGMVRANINAGTGAPLSSWQRWGWLQGELRWEKAWRSEEKDKQKIRSSFQSDQLLGGYSGRHVPAHVPRLMHYILELLMVCRWLSFTSA